MKPCKKETLTQKPRNYIVILLLIIAALAFFTFCNTLQFNFISNMNDDALVTQNASVQDLSWNGIKFMFTNFVFGLYHPLTTLSFAIDFKIFGMNPIGFHLTNLLLHLFNSLLVFVLIQKLFSQKQAGAFVIAALFAVQPLHTESVAWISERKDVLYSFFFLAGLISYILYGENSKKRYYVFTFMFYLLSVLLKSAAIIFPLVLVLIDYIKSNKILTLKYAFKIAPFLLISLIFGIINLYAQQTENLIRDLSTQYTFADRGFILAYSVLYYLVKSFIPFGLSPKHYYPLKEAGFLPYEFYLSVIILIVLLIFLIKIKDKKGYFKLGMLFYLSIIFLTLKIIPTGNDVVSDRYAYLPIIGVFFPLLYIESWKKWCWVLFSIVLIVFIFITINYSKTWKDSVNLWTCVIQKNPDNYLAYNQRGQAYMDNKDYSLALADLKKSVQIHENNLAFLNMGLIYLDLSKLDLARKCFTKSIALDSVNETPRVYRGIVFSQQKLYPEAVNDLETAIKMNPGNYSAYNNLGITFSLMKQKKSAVKSFEKGIELNKYNLDSYLNLARLYLIDSSYCDAVNVCNKGLLQFRNSVDLLEIKAESLSLSGRMEEAVKEYQKLLIADKKNSSKYLFLMANIYIRHEQWQKALVYLHSALDQSPLNGGILGNLGNCYLKMNKPDSACYYWNLSVQQGNKRMEQMVKTYCNPAVKND